MEASLNTTLIAQFGTFALFACWLVPLLIVALSKRVDGGAKVGWVILTLFFGILALAAFLILTRSSSRAQNHRSESDGSAA